METSEYRELRVRLEEELAAVRRQLADHGAAEDGDGVEVAVDEGFADSGHATAERSQVLAMVEGLLEHRGEIVAALERMDEGRYGRCERCGAEIAYERLDARPTARLCLPCKQAVGA